MSALSQPKPRMFKSYLGRSKVPLFSVLLDNSLHPTGVMGLKSMIRGEEKKNNGIGFVVQI